MATIGDLNQEDRDLIFKTLGVVLVSILKAHGVKVKEAAITDIKITEEIDDQGVGPGLQTWCCFRDQNGNRVCVVC